MMIANVMYAGPLTRGSIRGSGDSDTYVFDLTSPPCHTCQGERVVTRACGYYPQGSFGTDQPIPSGFVSHACPDCFGSAKRWTYRGKVHHDVFITVDAQGYERIPQEFYAALDEAYVTQGPVEFPDPFLEDLTVQGA